MAFADDPRKIKLSTFRFRSAERFEYQYDFGNNWEHKLTVEKILPADAAQTYPLCIAGRGKFPPQDSGGPWMYMARLQNRSQGRTVRDDSDPFDVEDVNRILRDLHTGWFTRAKNIG